MSTIINTSSSLPRPYIGSCHNRNYISNKPSSSLLLNNYYSSTKNRSSKSHLPNQLKQKNYLSNNILQQRVPIKYGSSPILFNERQLSQEPKAKDFLTSTSVFVPPHRISQTYYDRSSSSLNNDQQQYNQKQFYNHSSIENNSTSSPTNLLNDISDVIYNNTNGFKSSSSSTLISSENNFNNYLFSHPYSSNISQLNNMSTLDSNRKTHTYDQRISDQGNKYLIQLKTDDYQENEFLITPRLYNNQLIIDAKHNEEDSYGGFIRRELHKIFVIPKHIDLNKYTYSYNKNTQELTIEMPYLQTNNNNNNESSINTNQSLTFSYDNINLASGDNILSTMNSSVGNNNSSNESANLNKTSFDFEQFHRSAFRPQIIKTSKQENKLIMSLDLYDYQPEDIKISIKDQELIVKAERKIETDTKKSRTSFFQSTSLPPQTDIDNLQSNYVDGKLLIEAPYLNTQNKTNEKTVINSQKTSIYDDPYQQRTETVIEFVRLRRL